MLQHTVGEVSSGQVASDGAPTKTSPTKETTVLDFMIAPPFVQAQVWRYAGDDDIELLRARKSSGFTIVELMAAIGVILVLIALGVPLLQQGTSASKGVKALSGIRQMATGVQGYASENRDSPPVFGYPEWPAQTPWQFDFGTLGEGNWFEHQSIYSIAITGYLGNTEVANCPGAPTTYQVHTHQGQQVSLSGYELTGTLYAHPSFFRWETQIGPEQFAPQRLSDAVFPSQKGMMTQTFVYHNPKFGPTVACCAVDVPSPVVFFDLSAEELVLAQLNRGIINLYAGALLPGGMNPQELPGPPVNSTIDGLLGRDR
ncbi:MAG: type II secretion system protein [Phycisphaerales bacterium]|nr:type II secretion system protein [Phycisphaerales bacterium]